MAQSANARVQELKRLLLDALTDAVMDTLEESCYVRLTGPERARLWEKINDALRNTSITI